MLPATTPSPEKTTNTVTRKAASLRTDGVARDSGSLMPTRLSSPRNTLRR